MRVSDLAKELGIPKKKMLEKLQILGVNVNRAKDQLEDHVVEKLRDEFDTKRKKKTVKQSTEPAKKGTAKDGGSRSEVVGDEILLDGAVTVQEFAGLIGLSGPQLVGSLIKMGKMLPLSAELPPDIAENIAAQYGFRVVAVEEDAPEEETIDPEKLLPKPPVVTVMGHVDHGKTSLLDAIRKTQVAEKEAGGITQHIGASWVNLPEGRIVFLDTPGHEAFTALRARGAHITDIVILIVAADDGVMPQTIEAINHAKDANVPIVVAINKIDKANADVETVKKQLSTHNLLPEEWGGQTPMVEISAKQGLNISELLEVVLLQAEMMELTAVFEGPAKGVVIESRLDKGKGPVATVLVQAGTLRKGDPVISGSHWGKIRNMLDWHGEPAFDATPSTPVEILGLSGVPLAGDVFEVVDSDKFAKEQALAKQAEEHQKILTKTNKISFDDLFSQLQTGAVKELKIVIKTDVQGSLEAIEDSLEKLGSGEIKIKTIHTAIGGITDNDVMLASASNAVIIGFNVRPTGATRQLADREKVEIRTYRVIYDLLNDVKAALEGMLEPEKEEVIHGQAEVRQTFQIPKIGTIAGCYVISGKILRNSSARLIRDSVVVWEGKLGALRRFKDDVREVAQGFECGIQLDGYQDLKNQDIIECYTIEDVKK